jgi:CheY-like chemotaxis protein
MSHEIRTPLNGIISITEIMLRETGEKNIRDMLDTVKYSADHLLGIINDILDFSKIESGKVSFENISFNPKLLVENLKKVMQFKANEKDLQFTLDWDSSIPEKLIGDKVKLNQILTNLLGNAFKFTEKGLVAIKVKRVGGSAKNKATIEFAVADSGIGIPADKLESVFQSFTQSTQSITRKFGGTGLGLTITKRLVELQGGTILLESEEDKGSVFTVTLDFGIDKSKMKKEKSVPVHQRNELIGTRILIVEDNQVNQFVAVKILKNWGIEPIICENGVEAIKMLSRETFDLILLDLHMPLMDGYETCKIIRDKNSSVINHDVPVIALSADAFTQNRQRILDVGMNDFTTKPINQTELYTKMLALLKINNK